MNEAAEIDSNFALVVANDPIVAHFVAGLNAGRLSETAALRGCIVQLVMQKAARLQQLLELQSIVPRRRRLPNGKIIRWDAPDVLVPIEELE